MKFIFQIISAGFITHNDNKTIRLLLCDKDLVEKEIFCPLFQSYSDDATKYLNKLLIDNRAMSEDVIIHEESIDSFWIVETRGDEVVLLSKLTIQDLMAMSEQTLENETASQDQPKNDIFAAAMENIESIGQALETESPTDEMQLTEIDDQQNNGNDQDQHLNQAEFLPQLFNGAQKNDHMLVPLKNLLNLSVLALRGQGKHKYFNRPIQIMGENNIRLIKELVLFNEDILSEIGINLAWQEAIKKMLKKLNPQLTLGMNPDELEALLEKDSADTEKDIDLSEAPTEQIKVKNSQKILDSKLKNYSIPKKRRVVSRLLTLLAHNYVVSVRDLVMCPSYEIEAFDQIGPKLMIVLQEFLEFNFVGLKLGMSDHEIEASIKADMIMIKENK